MIPVTRTSLPPLETYVEYLEAIWASAHLTNNGPLCCELREALKRHLGVAQLELVSNGTLALQLAIRALGLTGEIITTPYSYVATTNAILWEGCDPVFVDIDRDTLCIDPDLIERAITPQTSAILATHVYGYPCDVDAIDAIAKRHGLRVIYDAAHAFGVTLDGRSLLAYGDCSTLSFHATKLFQTAEGGAVACRDAETANRLFRLASFGHIGEDHYVQVGINAKLSELHAAMGLSVLPLVSSHVESRRRVAAVYDDAFEGLPLWRPQPPAGLIYNYAYYPVVFGSGELMLRVRHALLAQDILPRRYFSPSLNTLPFLREDLKRSCPVSEDIAGRVLALPMSAELTEAEVIGIATLVRDCLAASPA